MHSAPLHEELVITAMSVRQITIKLMSATIIQNASTREQKDSSNQLSEDSTSGLCYVNTTFSKREKPDNEK